MAETQEASVQQSTEQNGQQQNQEGINPFGATSWSEQLPTPAQNQEATNGQQPTSTQTNGQAAQPKPEDEEEILEPTEWLKREYGFDSPETLKQSIDELKTLREKTAKPYEYKNADSQKIAEYINEGKVDELYSFLDRQKKVNKLSSVDLSDKNTAIELVKFGIKNDNPNLNDDEVDFLFGEKYAMPPKPVPSDTDLEGEYDQKVQAWQTQIANIEKRLIIEAKMAQPKLAQLKSEIVLPEISKPQVQNNEPTAEQIAEVKRIRKNFLNKLETDFSKVEGFTTQVKNELVDLPIQFKIPQEEKAAIKSRLEKEGMDVQDYMFGRWVDEKTGEWNIERLITDIYDLENRDKILSAIANNAANKMWETYQKSQKNLNVGQQTFQQTFQPQQNNTGVSPFSETSWTEKLPVPTA